MNAFPVLPEPAFAPVAPFWEAARRGQLALPRCTSCGAWVWYPGDACDRCGHPLEWVVVRPDAVVHAATRIHHVFHPAFADLVPYRVALAEPVDAPGVRLVVRVEGDGPVPSPGAALAIRFLEVDGTAMPVATVVDETATA